MLRLIPILNINSIPMKILIMDTDKTLRKGIEKQMRTLKHDVQSTEDTFEGLALCEKEKYDLVISDIRLPAISGLSLVSVVNEFVRRKVPIVILSLFRDDDLIDTCARLGAVEFLLKPIDFDKLKSICARYE
jgi:DNA-binding NtrC family response regulator